MCVSVFVLWRGGGAYHQHMLQQSQVSSGTLITIAQSSHLDIFADLRMVGSFLRDRGTETPELQSSFRQTTSVS